MDKQLTADQLTWQKLVGEKSLSQLSVSELEFIRKVGSEHDYILERRVYLEMGSTTNNIEPRPLILTDEKKRGIVIPLYQTLIAIAASFVIGFFLMKSSEIGSEDPALNPTASVDTLYIDRIERDTVLRTETEFVDRVVYVQNPSSNIVQSNFNQEHRGIAFQESSNMIPELSTMKLNNGGRSALNDETMVLLDNFSLTGTQK